MKLYLAILLLILATVHCQFDFSNMGKKEEKEKPKPRKPEDIIQTFGVLLLDDLTYPQLSPNRRDHMVVMVSNKASKGPHSDSIKADYFQIAKSTPDSLTDEDNVLFTQILVNGAENMMLAKRIISSASASGDESATVDIKKQPAFYLIRTGDTHESAILLSNGDVAKAMGRLQAETGIALIVPGTRKDLNEMVQVFFSEAAGDKQNEQILKVKALLTALPTSKDKEAEKFMLEWYMKSMEKVVEKGVEWIDFESNRLNDILKSDKVSESRKSDFKTRLNIVKAFSAAQGRASNRPVTPTTESTTDVE